jgi:hypothetical protein
MFFSLASLCNVYAHLSIECVNSSPNYDNKSVNYIDFFVNYANKFDDCANTPND